MTTTTLRATIRRRINQTSNTNTQWSDAIIDELGDQGRRMFAAILPEDILTALKKTGSLSPSSGAASYPADFLRNLDDPLVTIDGIQARKIEKGEMWRMKWILYSSNLTAGSSYKYYWLTSVGINCLPTDATAMVFPYLRIPDVLDASANTDMPLDVDDMVIDYVFEKLMATRRGDKELATMLAQQRGYLTKVVMETA